MHILRKHSTSSHNLISSVTHATGNKQDQHIGHKTYEYVKMKSISKASVEKSA